MHGFVFLVFVLKLNTENQTEAESRKPNYVGSGEPLNIESANIDPPEWSWLRSFISALFPSMNLTYQKVWVVKSGLNSVRQENHNHKQDNDPVTKGTGEQTWQILNESKPDIFRHHIRLYIFFFK